MLQGLSTALTALYASRQALETTGNNIANVNTVGYARERVDQSDINYGSASFWSTGQQTGQGVNVTGISRITDQFLAAQATTAHGQSGQYNATNTALQNIQSAFNEPSDQGLQQQLSDFWSSWDALGQGNGDDAARTAVVEKTVTLTTNIQQINSSLNQQSTLALSTLKGDVSQINSYATSIASLNKAIIQQTNSGVQPNALLDQREALVSKLSNLAGITVQPTDANGVRIIVGGTALVSDDKTNVLQVDESGSPVVLRWDDDGNPNTTTDGQKVTLSGGDAAGQLDVLNNVIPKYKTMLNSFATSLMSTVNAQHQAGQDKTGTAGVAFFSGTNASDIQINPTIAADPGKIAASASGGGELDLENANAMANLATLSNGPDVNYRQLINVLGTDAQRTSSQATIQQNITNNADSSVQSVQGVNLDEEMTNMVQYQRAYESAAKYLSVVNSTMDSLLGLIG